MLSELLVLLLCSAPSVLGDCAWGRGVQSVDFAAAQVEMQMVDSAGEQTTKPFPSGGSIRWTNIGRHNDQNFDLLVMLHPDSRSAYVRIVLWPGIYCQQIHRVTAKILFCCPSATTFTSTPADKS